MISKIASKNTLIHTLKQFSSSTMKESWPAKTMYHLRGHLDINLVKQVKMEFSI